MITDQAQLTELGGPLTVVGIVWYVLVAIALWKTFTKAGYPGILAIIPIVNLIFLVKVAGFSGWLVLLYLIPIVNVIMALIVAIKVGANFGKGPFFSILLLWLLPFIGYFVIGYGSARYQRA